MSQHRFIVCSYTKSLSSGTVSWQSPSNIALVKYWGKYGEQMPMNASVSCTLKNCNTKTSLSFEKKDTEGFDFEVYLDGQREVSFEPKIKKFFERGEVYLPCVNNFKFRLDATNRFPHRSGIASSASAMSALAVCVMDRERRMQPEIPDAYFV